MADFWYGVVVTAVIFVSLGWWYSNTSRKQTADQIRRIEAQAEIAANKYEEIISAVNAEVETANLHSQTLN